MSKVNVPIAFMSLVISLLLWVNVYNSQSDRAKSKTLSFTIKVNSVNLDDSKFVLSDSPDDISVTVAGTAAQIRAVRLQDVTGFVDLAAVKLGTASYPVIVVPTNIRELLVNPTLTARIKIEPLQVKEVPVTVNRIGKLADKNSQVEAIDTFPRTMYIVGTVDAIQKATSVAVNADLTGSVNSPEGMELEAHAVDSAGRLIPRVLLSGTGKDVHYKEEELSKPFLIRVRVKLTSPEVLPK